MTILMLNLMILACGLPGLLPTQPAPSDTPSETASQALPSEPFTKTPAATETVQPSSTSTASLTPTAIFTPTVTETTGPSATPTFAFPVVTVNKQAHCRYGPNVAYLHAADLYAGDTGTVRGRFQFSKWLFVKFDKLKYFCWVAPSVVDVTGDINTIKFTDVFLPGPSVLYNPPHNVTVERDGKVVNINWEAVPMTDDDDRGYFLDMFVCQGGAYLWYPVALDNRDKTSYSVKDEAGCPAASGGKLYAVEKHGYTNPVELNWPQP